MAEGGRSAIPDSDNPNIRAFNALYATHEIRLRGLALSLTGRALDADEIVQDASLVLWEKFEEFVPGSNFFAWAASIIHFKVKELRRRRGREKLWLGDEILREIASESVKLSEVLERRERAMSHCILSLKEDQMQLLRLRYEKGSSVGEISRLLGRSEVAVRKSLSRLRQALGDCITRRLEAEGGL